MTKKDKFQSRVRTGCMVLHEHGEQCYLDEDEKFKCETTIAPSPAPNDWIKCSERLPEDFVDVQVLLQANEVGVGWYGSISRMWRKFFSGTNRMFYETNLVQAWRPLELTKEEAKVDKEHCPRCGERNTDIIHTCTPIKSPIYEAPNNEPVEMNADGAIKGHTLYSSTDDAEIWVKNKSFSLGENAAKIDIACNTLKDLLIKKNKAYGNSFAISGDFLKLLYPEGVKPEQYQNMLTLARIFDKMKRIATDCNNREDSWQDIAGYSVLQMVNRKNRDE